MPLSHAGHAVKASLRRNEIQNQDVVGNLNGGARVSGVAAADGPRLSSARLTSIEFAAANRHRYERNEHRD
jgi:hypothetical protein